jgi:large subunit ribosomal protein L21
MYAVVSSGGKQYRVQKGEIFRVEKLPGSVGDPVSFDQVLLYSDGEKLNIGQPTVSDIFVRGRIVEQDRGRKIIVFKYKRRKRYRRKQGHRQSYTAVRIDWMGMAEPEESGTPQLQEPGIEVHAAGDAQ